MESDEACGAGNEDAFVSYAWIIVHVIFLLRVSGFGVRVLDLLTRLFVFADFCLPKRHKKELRIRNSIYDLRMKNRNWKWKLEILALWLNLFSIVINVSVVVQGFFFVLSGIWYPA